MPAPQTLPALNAWHVLELQLIAFPETPQVAVQQNWWQDLIGVGDFSSSRKGFERTDEGVFEGRAFKLQIDPLRIAWIMGSVLDATIPENLDRMPTAGEFQPVVDWFSGIMSRWLVEMCPPIKRLAFSGKLYLQTATREEAYEFLDRYLPHVEVDIASTEFQYRINRPRASTIGIGGLTINRLVTWSAIKFAMQIQARGSLDTPATHYIDREHNGCLLQLDINSSPDFKERLPQDRLSDLWQELVALGGEIAANGDIR